MPVSLKRKGTVITVSQEKRKLERVQRRMERKMISVTHRERGAAWIREQTNVENNCCNDEDEPDLGRPFVCV